jgi:hypothetical protein
MRTIFRLIFASFVAAIVAAGQTAKAVWKGSIATENGIKMVKNPAEPLYGTFTFELQEDLKIGGDPGKENYYIPNGGVLNVDESGNLYFADYGNIRIQIFDKSGKFVRTVGRKGQGPGEFMYPTNILFDAAGNICVTDGIDITVFDKNGIFKNRIVLKSILSYFMIGPRGSIIGVTQPSAVRSHPKLSLLALDTMGGNPKTLAEYEGEWGQAKRAISVHWYSNHLVFCPLTDSAFAYGFSGEYTIHIADETGHTTLLTMKEETPRPITGREKDETMKKGVYSVSGSNDLKEGVFFPDHRSFFSRFFNDDKGRLYVVKTGSILEKTAPKEVDVFSKDGIYLYKMTWPAFPSAIKNGCLYEVREDKETGEYTIVRSRIKNWEKMKTGAE